MAVARKENLLEPRVSARLQVLHIVTGAEGSFAGLCNKPAGID
jgi:hypothetical protein